MTAAEILQKHEDDNEMHLHHVDRKWVIQAMEEYAKFYSQRLETLAKLLAKTWFYGEWEWENPNERIQQMIMQDLGYYPFKDEDEMIRKTKVDSYLCYKTSNFMCSRGDATWARWNGFGAEFCRIIYRTFHHGTWICRA